MKKLDFKPEGLLFDLDGTLLDRQKKIRPDVKQLMDEVRTAGIKIGAATGRQFSFLKKMIFPHFAAADLHVVSGGAEVMRNDGQVVWGEYIPSETVKTIWARLTQAGAEVFFGQQEMGYFNRLDLTEGGRLRGLPMHDPKKENLEDWQTPLLVVDNLTQEVEAEMGQMAVEGWLSDLSLKKMRHGTLDPKKGHFYYDITLRGLNKGTGMLKWAAEWGIAPEKIIAFGDNANDVEFLKMSGQAVVIETGTPTALAQADEIIPSVEEGGLQKYLTDILKTA